MDTVITEITLPVLYYSLAPHQRREVRERYIQKQKGRCSYCGAPLTGPPTQEVAEKKTTPKLFPPRFFDHPIHLHHNHNTGFTIGAVHAHCNAVLWEHEGE